MATVNLSWTTPTSTADVDSVEIYRWTGQTSTNTAGLAALITAGAVKIATVAKTATSYSDTSAPTAALTYATVSRNTAGFKLEDGGHVDITTT